MENKNFKRIDVGFCLNYRKLSNRRKFIRTLWVTPVLLISIVGMWYYGFAIPYMLIVLATYIIQLVCTFSAWKREKADYTDRTNEK